MPGPNWVIPELESDESDEEDVVVESVSVANLVVTIVLTRVLDCWVILKSEVDVAIGMKQDTSPVCWALSKLKLALPPSSDTFMQPVACCPAHCL